MVTPTPTPTPDPSAPPSQRKRYSTELHTTDPTTGRQSYQIIDHQFASYHLPRRAVNLYLTQPDAEAVARILNDAWSAFTADPW